MSLAALTRAVSPRIDQCELTHRERVRIDPERAVAQHRAYQAALEAAGCRLLPVRPAPELPDSVFVEDTAVVTDDLAVIARPGARSRRPEVDAVAELLERFRPLVRIRAPGTLDGGDVLQVGRHVLVGRSGRTNAHGVAQLRAALEPMGHTVRAVGFTGCLHLKTAVTALGDDVLLVNPEWVAMEGLEGYHLLNVDSGEPFAANALAVGGVVMVAAGAPATARRIEALGMDVVGVDVSELAKAEAGLTCCSILLHP